MRTTKGLRARTEASTQQTCHGADTVDTCLADRTRQPSVLKDEAEVDGWEWTPLAHLPLEGHVGLGECNRGQADSGACVNR